MIYVELLTLNIYQKNLYHQAIQFNHKMTAMKYPIVFLLAFSLLVKPLIAQRHVGADYNRVSAGLTGGLLTPFSDIKQHSYFPAFDELTLGGGLKLEYHISPAFGLRGQFLLGTLSGKDDSQDRYFKAELWEANLSSVISFSKLLSPRWAKNDRIDIYGVLGLGMVSYRSRLFNSLTDEVVSTFGYNSTGTQKESRLNDLVIPFGMGVRFNLTNRIDLEIESGFRMTQTDGLDALRRVFSNFDAYNYTNIGIVFKLGKNTRAMKWASPSVVMYPGDVTRMDYLVERVTEVDRRVEGVDQRMLQSPLDREIEELRRQVQAIDQRQNDLGSRVASLSDRRPGVSEASVASLMGVFFRLNSSAIDNLNYERIASAARFMNANPQTRVELIGHTDITGPSAFNFELSEKRARAVYDVLVNDFKINPDRLSISHRGPNDPLSRQNLSINRRVDFKVIE